MESGMGVLFQDVNVPALFREQRRNCGACRSTSDHQHVTTCAGFNDRREAVHLERYWQTSEAVAGVYPRNARLASGRQADQKLLSAPVLTDSVLSGSLRAAILTKSNLGNGHRSKEGNMRLVGMVLFAVLLIGTAACHSTHVQIPTAPIAAGEKTL